MGAFYGSVHVRSDDAAAVRRALEDLATERGTRFLVAAPVRGWISVYPSDHGQDASVSEAIASAIPVPVLHLLVHDDGLFAYTLHDVGGLIDEYCSNPDYFEPSAPERWQETAGRPDVLAALTGGGDSAHLATILRRDGKENAPFRASWQLERVGEALGIANVETSYEYLRGGETRGIKGFKDFVHIPDLSTEKLARRRWRAEIATETKRLRAEGLLLLTTKRGGGRAHISPRPIFCAAARTGFLVAWENLATAEPAALELWEAPWQEPSEIAVDASSGVHWMRASAAGGLFVIGFADGNCNAQLFDLGSGRSLTKITLPRIVHHTSLTADEQWLICRTPGELTLISTANGHVERSMSLGLGCSAALHPDGNWLAADVRVGSNTVVGLVEVRENHVARLLKTKANDFAGWMAAVESGERVPTGFHPHEIPNRLEFTADGRFLVMAVSEGVRVYSWQDVLRSDEALPNPVASAETDLVRVETSWLRNTYGFEIDHHRDAVFFGALDGRVRALHLATGKVSTVFEVPGTPPVIALAQSQDGAALATVAHPGMFERGKRPPTLFQVWDLAKSLSRSG